MNSRLAVSTAALGVLCAQSVNAAVVAAWDFNALPVAGVQITTAAPNVVAPNVVTTGVTPKANLAPRAFIQTKSIGGSTSSPLLSLSYLLKTEATADYVQFSVAPAAGYELDLSSLTMDVIRGSTSATRGYYVRSSVDGYASNLLYQANIPTANSEGATGTWLPQNANLSGLAAMQNVTTPVSFRIYAFITGGGTVDSAINFDNIVVNGAVSVVPEPAILGLLGVAGLVLARRHRA